MSTAARLRICHGIRNAVIPVERIDAPVLLVCGENDRLWPSCTMARAVSARREAQGLSATTLLAYAEAGHLGFGEPVPADHEARESLAMLGGTVEGNAAARADAWPKTLQFLNKSLVVGNVVEVDP
jgi:dienelactone hydrolase